MSKITGSVVLHAASIDPSVPGHVVASALAVIAGGIICFIGLAKLGWLVEFISLAAISAYMTGSALNIAVGQVPGLMGISKKVVDSRAPTYHVIYKTLQHLGATQLDAALGLTALLLLYLIRSGFNYLSRRQPQRRRVWFFCNTLRTVFVILLYTFISWLVNGASHRPYYSMAKSSPFAILGHVPRGFQDAAVPVITPKIITLFASELPATVIVLLIEHISISKSFGRINNYTIDPSQELVAIGVSNLLGPFLGAYPATGSFSRTAIKSKAGVRTPIAGLYTAIVVLLAIYALPAVFFYIPSAALSAVIIHAVGDLITPPNTVYQFWRINPLEVVIFFAGVLVTVFTTIENGVYTTVCTSLALLLFRVFKAQGRFVGKVTVHSVIGDHLIEGDEPRFLGKKDDGGSSSRDIFLPIGNPDGSNPEIRPTHPYPGVFIYRFSEGFNYPNANHYLDYMVRVVFQETQRTNPNSYGRPGDRPWNDPGPRRGKERLVDDDRPTLKAIILDFSSVNNVDITSVQNLIDVRNQLDRYAAPDKVQWHIACINNRWSKRALASAGFGYPTPDSGGDEFQRWKPVFSVADIGGIQSAAAAAEAAENREMEKQKTRGDPENGLTVNQTEREVDSIEAESSAGSSGSNAGLEKTLGKTEAYKKSVGVKVAVVQGLNRPFFHLDLTSALQSAIHNLETLKAQQKAEMVDVMPDVHT